MGRLPVVVPLPKLHEKNSCTNIDLATVIPQYQDLSSMDKV